MECLRTASLALAGHVHRLVLLISSASRLRVLPLKFLIMHLLQPLQSSQLQLFPWVELITTPLPVVQRNILFQEPLQYDRRRHKFSPRSQPLRNVFADGRRHSNGCSHKMIHRRHTQLATPSAKGFSHPKVMSIISSGTILCIAASLVVGRPP